MRTLLLDSGAFIAIERRDRKLGDLLLASAKDGNSVVVPASVIAEVWRQPPRPLSSQLIEAITAVVPLDLPEAKRIGALMGKTATASVVDANVASIAARLVMDSQRVLVLTSDPEDILMLVRAAGVASCRMAAGTATKTTDVVVERI